MASSTSVPLIDDLAGFGRQRRGGRCAHPFFLQEDSARGSAGVPAWTALRQRHGRLRQLKRTGIRILRERLTC
ncbi:hypothetical protein QW131_12085 [Roseibium salinum]|nr:hypothetical protein [Roseibium salinum]